MKKRISVFVSMSLSLIFSTSAFANNVSVIDQPLTQNQIKAKFLELSYKYKPNELFSCEDETFVKKYAVTVNPNSRKTRSLSWGTGDHFIGYGRGNYTSIKTEGYVKVDLGLISNTIQVNMNTSDTSQKAHSKIGNSVKFQAFGVYGTNGIGIVADFTLSDSIANTTYHKFLTEKSFMASVAYFQCIPLGYVKDNHSGSQDIAVNFD